MILPEKRAQIIEALKANPNARAVAKQVGDVTHVTVGKIAKRAGIELTAGKAVKAMGGKLRSEQRARIIAALDVIPAKEIIFAARALIARASAEQKIQIARMAAPEPILAPSAPLYGRSRMRLLRALR